MDLYELVRGPLAVAAFAVLILGSLYRALSMIKVGKKAKMLYPQASISGGLRSILHHLLPFGASYMRARTVFTVITFLFHMAVIILPIFLMSHIVLWFESFGFLWWELSKPAADTMTAVVVIACLFFIGRRLFVSEVRQVSSASEYLLPILILIVFLTGFCASHQWGPYRPMLIFHIATSEILIALIPFSRLMHMLFFPFSRAYMGAEHSRVLGAKDW